MFFDGFFEISSSQHFRNTDRQTCVLATFQCCFVLKFSLVILPWFDFVLLPFVDCTDGSMFLTKKCVFYGHPANHDVLEDAFVGSQSYVFSCIVAESPVEMGYISTFLRRLLPALCGDF